MIEFFNVSKIFKTARGPQTLLQDVNICFPSKKSVALLGRNGAGKSSLLKMISGAITPDSGRIETKGSISWPVGFSGSFHQHLTGVQNTRFIARVYGIDTDELVDFVQEFAQLGEHFKLPVRSYSSGMRSRLAFGISMGIHFDTYLIDEVTSVGDAAFREKCNLYFSERLSNSGAIVVTHSPRMVRLLCEEAVVLHNGSCQYFKDLEEGIAVHHENLGTTAPKLQKEV